MSPSRFEKEVLRVGRWVHPAGKFVLEVTRERLARWAKAFRRMVEKGVRVPVPYGHSYDARDNAGFVSDMRVEEDRLVAVLDIPREEDAARIGATATDVSVSINPDYVDGEGERYGEVIEHVAITNYPVVSGQENFVPLAREGDGETEVVRLEMERAGEAAAEGAVAESEESVGAEDTTTAEFGAKENALATDAAEADALQMARAEREALSARVEALEEERVEREVESLVMSGRVPPAVEGHVRRLLAVTGRVQLGADGEATSPAEELRAILGALPARAWVPLAARAAEARPVERRSAELSDERARELGRENARLVARA